MNDFLRQLGVIDIRERLPRAAWSIGRRSATTSLTYHYNGPPVPLTRQRGPGLIAQLRIDAAYQMKPGWGGTKDGADGLMYHLVVGADGAILLARDLDALLWHCGHGDGNSHGLALHLPIGGSQAPTPAQLASTIRLTDALRSHYRIPLARTLGHLEWKHATLCPGPALMAAVRSYRSDMVPIVVPTPTPAGLRRWQIRWDLGVNANVRQGPGVSFPVAGRMKPGTILYIDVVNHAEPADPRHPQWVHMARVANEQADLGFVAAELGAWV